MIKENSSGSDIFKQDPFKEFTEQKLTKYLKKEKFEKLLNLREEAIKTRAKT